MSVFSWKMKQSMFKSDRFVGKYRAAKMIQRIMEESTKTKF
jgi:hypothetical protein